jgi:hypothetical protein
MGEFDALDVDSISENPMTVRTPSSFMCSDHAVVMAKLMLKPLSLLPSGNRKLIRTILFLLIPAVVKPTVRDKCCQILPLTTERGGFYQMKEYSRRRFLKHIVS